MSENSDSDETAAVSPTEIEHQREDLARFRDEFYEDRRQLIEGEAQAVQSFDRAMLTLSGGGLALSIAFVRVVGEDPTHTGLLLSSWIAFGFALVSTVTSFYFSKEAFRKKRPRRQQRYQRESHAYLEEYGDRAGKVLSGELEEEKTAQEDDSEGDGKNKDEDKSGERIDHSRWIKPLNIAAALLLLTGAGFLIAFSYLNL